MGEQEKVIKRRQRIGKIEKAILGTIAVAGVLSMAVVAPNALQALYKLGLIKGKKNQRQSAGRSIQRLVDKKLVVIKNTGRGKVVRLTETGERVLRMVDAGMYKLKKPKRWDGKWRIIIFDVRERKRGIRDKLRRTLLQIGFVRLQNSVWVYPYDCEDLVKLLKADFRIGREVLYVIADSIENDMWMRKEFSL